MKRLLDVLISLLMLAVMAIPMGVVALTIRLTMGAPVIYKSLRPGRNGVLFTMYKFRTMTDDRDASGELLWDEARLTRFGRVLRATSLDELPELLNVLKGDMSLVGPRPLLPEYLDRYTSRQARRLEVRPGVTGLAQVRGRNAVSWEERLEMDVWYVENRTMPLDLKILADTILTVVRQDNVSAPGYATMPEFKGSSDGPPKPG